MVRKCGICRQEGHNSQTCPLAKQSPIKKQIKSSLSNGKSPRKQSNKKCGLCGGFGHNKRTCPLKIQQTSEKTKKSICKLSKLPPFQYPDLSSKENIDNLSSKSYLQLLSHSSQSLLKILDNLYLLWKESNTKLYSNLQNNSLPNNCYHLLFWKLYKYYLISQEQWSNSYSEFISEIKIYLKLHYDYSFQDSYCYLLTSNKKPGHFMELWCNPIQQLIYQRKGIIKKDTCSQFIITPMSLNTHEEYIDIIHGYLTYYTTITGQYQLR